VLIAGAIPTARTAALGSAAVTVALGTTPVVVTVLRGGTDLGVAVVVAGLVGGATLAWAVDDTMADVLACAPLGNTVRFRLRLGFVAVVVLLGWAVAAVFAAVGPGIGPHLATRGVESATAAALAVGLGAASARAGERHAAVGGIVGSFVAMLTVAALALQWRGLPTFLSGPTHGRWWWVTAIGVLVAVRSARDPGRR